MPEIRTPFPNVTVHIMEAPAVRGEVADGSSFLAILPFGATAIGIVAVVVGNIAGEGFAKVERGFSTGAAGIFPLGFAGQAVGASGGAGEAGASFGGFVPTDGSATYVMIEYATY
ncbi:MAG: hypothetical protein Fur0042_25850 [Cyanophyceae cyanobacterium]